MAAKDLTRSEAMYELGRVIGNLDRLLKNSEVAGMLGPGLVGELRYPCVAYRSRFREFMPDTQQQLTGGEQQPAR